MNNTVKRKFNALLQGIGNRPSTETSEPDPFHVDPASSPTPASQHSSPRTSTTMAPTDAASLDLHKKRRVAGPTSTPTKYSAHLQPTTPMRSSPASIRSVPPTTTISNVTLRKWTPGGASSSPAADARDGTPPPPKYCPGDRDQLLRRLATFQELTDWTPKPDRVSEVEWAKRGWACLGKERVRCALCAAELAVRVNLKEVDGKEIAVMIASEIAESVVDKYAELIVEAHVEDCLWRKRGCDGMSSPHQYPPITHLQDTNHPGVTDSLLRLPLPNPKLALQSLRQRYDELCSRAPFLPGESSLRLPPTLNLDTIITYLPPTFFTSPPPAASTTTTQSDPKINRPALALSLLGWQSLTHPLLGHPVPNSASCHTCLRRLGLWMFSPRESADGAPLPAPMDHLDALREHRFFCPWKNAAAQRNPGKTATTTTTTTTGGEKEMAAWEVLVVGLRNEAFIRDKVAGTPQKAGGVHGRSKSSVPPGRGDSTGARAGGVPKTPERPTTVSGPAPSGGLGGGEERDGGEGVEEDGEEARRKKDVDMMSRLKRVKSLFNTKGGKLKRMGSRPGTAHSSVGPE